MPVRVRFPPQAPDKRRRVMLKSKNPETGIVHICTGRKITPIKLHEKLCGGPTGLVWLKANDELVTCRKCIAFSGGKERLKRD
jgi:hypothetical protein